MKIGYNDNVVMSNRTISHKQDQTYKSFHFLYVLFSLTDYILIDYKKF